MRCSRCGADLVEVDNPMRKEFRHRRGTECAGSEPALEVESPHMMAADSLPLHFDKALLDAAFVQQTKQPTQEVSRWVDAAMFRSEPMPVAENGRVKPTAYLLNATPDPLGSLAALNGIYTGKVFRSLAEVTDEDRRYALEQVFLNKLQGPLEVIQFHFLLEGVSRAFTHQIVRGRHAFYAQESLRFAVVEGDEWTTRVALPPSIAGTKDDRYHEPLGAESSPEEYQRNLWDEHVRHAEQTYLHLVGAGMPAEDARGIMPHAMTTRIHWVCSLRELLYVAGVRLCTQAQFEWRSAMASVVKCLREYANRTEGLPEGWTIGGPDAWQYEAMADLLRPICYQEGKCGFKAKADRACSIRDRVDANERVHRDPSKWDKPMFPTFPGEGGSTGPTDEIIRRIDPAEWLADPGAAR